MRKERLIDILDKCKVGYELIAKDTIRKYQEYVADALTEPEITENDIMEIIQEWEVDRGLILTFHDKRKLAKAAFSKLKG